MIAAGRLDKRVTILRPQRIANALGEPIVTYQPAVTVWASVTPMTAREVERARAAEMQTTHRVVMRWTSALAEDCRLSFASKGRATPRVLSVVGLVNVGERDDEWQISAVEVAGE